MYIFQLNVHKVEVYIVCIQKEILWFQHMVGTGMANPFPAAAAAAAAAQFAANGDALAGKAELAAGVPAAPQPPQHPQPPQPAQAQLVKSEGPPPPTPLPPANFSPQPPPQTHAQNSIENQNNSSVSTIRNEI